MWKMHWFVLNEDYQYIASASFGGFTVFAAIFYVCLIVCERIFANK